MKLKLMLVLGLVVSHVILTSCSTIYFHSTETNQSEELDYSEWHHDGLLGLVEFSDPVDLTNRCEGKLWSTVKVEQGLLQSVASIATQNLYNPWDVSFSCK